MMELKLLISQINKNIKKSVMRLIFVNEIKKLLLFLNKKLRFYFLTMGYILGKSAYHFYMINRNEKNCFILFGWKFSRIS